MYTHLFTGKLVKKYKFRALCKQIIGFKWKPIQNKSKDNRNKTSAVDNTVKAFYLRDDVSRLATGKKNTITVQKVKKQRRLLCDSLWNLYKKIVAEKGQLLFYASFCQKRPFWVVPPTERDRDTCLCKTHKNLQYMAHTLKKLGLLGNTHLDDMVASTVCKNSKECHYGECRECRLNVYPLLRHPNE